MWPGLDDWLFVNAKETPQKVGAGNGQLSPAPRVHCTVGPRGPGSRVLGSRRQKGSIGEDRKFGSKRVGIRHIGLCSARDESIILEPSRRVCPWPRP